MPRSFPDLDSLKWNAQMRNFRQPNEGESENDYRAALAQHVQDLGDMVEAMEIRSGKGWDQWDSHTTQAMLEEASPGIADILREAREQKVTTLMTAMEAAGPEQTLAILAELLGPSEKPVEDYEVVMTNTGKYLPTARRILPDEELDKLFDSIDPPPFENTGRLNDPLTYIFVFSQSSYLRAERTIVELIDKHSFLLFGDGVEQRVFGRVLRCNRALTHSMRADWEDASSRIAMLRRWCDRRLIDSASFVLAEINGERFVIKNHAKLKPSHIRKTADYALTREACPFPSLS